MTDKTLQITHDELTHLIEVSEGRVIRTAIPSGNLIVCEDNEWAVEEIKKLRERSNEVS